MSFSLCQASDFRGDSRAIYIMYPTSAPQDLGDHTPTSWAALAATGATGRHASNINRDVLRMSSGAVGQAHGDK